MSQIDEAASDIDYQYPVDKNIDAEWDLEPEIDEPPRDPKPEATALHQKQYEAVSVKRMNENGIRLDTLMYALCYGNPLCTAEPGLTRKVLKAARNELTKSLLLPKILNHLHTPQHHTGSRPQAASKALNRWAWNHTVRLSRAELD